MFFPSRIRQRTVNSLGWFYSLLQHPLRSQYAREDLLNAEEIRTHVAHLAEKIGPRPAGSEMARAASAYFADRLKEVGYAVHRQEYLLPDQTPAENVWADKEGALRKYMILAVHTDTVKDCPGANDDASGIAAVLAVARMIAGERLHTGVRFLAIGAEEALMDGFVKPGFGALHYVKGMKPEERAKVAGVIWVDKIGAGPVLEIRRIRETDASSAEILSVAGQRIGIRIVPRIVRRWEPVMPFEDAGFPTAWLEWRRDPHFHEPADTLANVSPRKVATAGTLLYTALLDPNGLVKIPIEEWRGKPGLVPSPAGSLRTSAGSGSAHIGSE